MVLLLVKRNPQPGSKPNYWVNSHLSACWSGKNASSMIDLTAALPSGPPLHHPNHPLSTFFHRGSRPKLNMSKQDDTDNSHNRSNHMSPHLETTERFFNFQITYKSWKTDCVTVMYRYIYASQRNVIISWCLCQSFTSSALHLSPACVLDTTSECVLIKKNHFEYEIKKTICRLFCCDYLCFH